MQREKLLQNCAPIDRVAYRVVKKAKPEDKWDPKIAIGDYHKISGNVLPTVAIPGPALAVASRVIGSRVGRMVCIGYSDVNEQKSQKASAKWVVRCDCGNYEHRTRIIRRLASGFDDQCQGRSKRMYLTKGWNPSRSTKKSQEAA